MAKKTTKSKRPAAKRTRSAKTAVKTAKTTVKATSKAKSAASKKAAKNVKLGLSLDVIHRAALLVNVVLAVLAGVIMGAKVVPMTVGHLTSDELRSTASETVLVPGSRVLFDVNLQWLVVALMAFGAVYALLLITRWQASYQKALQARIFFWRWAYLAVSNALLVGIIAVLSGAHDLLVVKLVSWMTVLGFAFAWLNERQNLGSRRPVVSSYLLTIAGVIMPWFLIGGYTLAGTIYGMINLPWYVYAAEGVALAGLILTLANLWFGHAKRGRWQDYQFTEKGYVLTTYVTQAAVAAILIIGLAK